MSRRVCPVCRERTQVATGECVCDRCMGAIPWRLLQRLNADYQRRVVAHALWQESLAIAIEAARGQ